MSATRPRIIRVASIDFDGHFANGNEVQTHIHRMILALPEDAPGDPLKSYLQELIRHAIAKKIKSGLDGFDIILNGSVRQTERWDLERLFANKNGLVIESLREYAREHGKDFHEVSSAGIKPDGSVTKMGFDFEKSKEAPLDLYKEALVERQIRYISAWAKANYPDGNYKLIYQFSDDFPKGTLRGLIHFLERSKTLCGLVDELRLTACRNSFHLKPLLDFLMAGENKDLMEPLSPTPDELTYFASQPFELTPYSQSGKPVVRTDPKLNKAQLQVLNGTPMEPAVIFSEGVATYPQQEKGSAEEPLKRLFETLKPQTTEVSAGAGAGVAITSTVLRDARSTRSSAGDDKRKREPEEAGSGR